ncbi:zinc-binding dehydrogenase [Bordetella sp. BOR01]|uniref:zinc-binding dehydrogenase n=1 Tax=Bordetella sp. BOR01 TaxID=2854779 RepID=UPI001C4574A6|nr:zinc-binding dehydrogenase [Bordetella sp. BOR01]MBV7482363.1 alcohol dehydrogenase catalytic domain-containing protein [Bordetella sp. BOR01]
MRAYAVQCFCAPVAPTVRTDPIPRGTEIVVDVQRCGVCHTDLHLQDGYYDLGGGKRLSLADRGLKPPLVLGHEIVGRLAAKGPDAPVADDDIGKLFLVYPWLGCGRCEVCLSGHENLCAAPNSIGVARPGGYAEQCLVPHPRYLVDIDGIDPTLAATYACSGLTAFSALGKVHIDKDKDLLLLLGLGGVGMAGLQLALAQGYQHIAVADLDPAKRDYALASGAALAVDPREASAAAALSAAGGVAAAVDFVGATSTVELAVAALRKGGTCVVVGLFGGDIALSLPPLVQRSITLRGSYVGSLQELKDLIDLAKSGKIRPLPVEAVQFDDINQALARLRQGKVQGRLVLSR